jgi:sensor histidine kinase YesM
MKLEKNNFFAKHLNFLFFKTLLWLSMGLVFFSFSVLIPISSDSSIKEIIVFLCLALVVNIHISYLFPKIYKKNKFGYIFLIMGSIIFCAFFELFLFSNQLKIIYSGILDKSKYYSITFGYIFIRNFAIFLFFSWVESFNRLIQLLHEKEIIFQKDMALMMEKQEYEKNFSRKKLLPHHFFNLLEHFYAKALENNNEYELLNKGKFVLYYFLVDAENEKIELEKELVFYKYYVDLDNFRYKNSITVKVNVVGEICGCLIIPLLFEPVIGNAMKYTYHDGSGQVDIEFDSSLFPVLHFRCKNNFTPHSKNLASSNSGLKMLKQRLELYYKDNYTLTCIIHRAA